MERPSRSRGAAFSRCGSLTALSLDRGEHHPLPGLDIAGVGHYGIFNGSRWRGRIAPVLEEWIQSHGG